MPILLTSKELKELLTYMIDLNDPKFCEDIQKIKTELMILNVCTDGNTLLDLIRK
jgi:hypothetical protein